MFEKFIIMSYTPLIEKLEIVKDHDTIFVKVGG